MEINLKYKKGKLYRNGKIAGSLRKDGYRHVRVNGKWVLEHRLIWFMHHGEWPKVIDHKNRVRDDNRIKNLRNGTQADNMRNLGKYAHTSDYGVGIYKARTVKEGYIAQATVAGVIHHLGTHPTAKKARKARKKWIANLSFT